MRWTKRREIKRMENKPGTRVKEQERKRERSRDRTPDKHTQTDTQTDRQTDRQTNKLHRQIYSSIWCFGGFFFSRFKKLSKNRPFPLPLCDVLSSVNSRVLTPNPPACWSGCAQTGLPLPGQLHHKHSLGPGGWSGAGGIGGEGGEGEGGGHPQIQRQYPGCPNPALARSNRRDLRPPGPAEGPFHTGY